MSGINFEPTITTNANSINMENENDTFDIPSYQELKNYINRPNQIYEQSFRKQVKSAILDKFNDITFNCLINKKYNIEKEYNINFNIIYYIFDQFDKLPISIKQDIVNKLSNDDWQFEYNEKTESILFGYWYYTNRTIRMICKKV
jgi:hypothetical protein